MSCVSHHEIFLTVLGRTKLCQMEHRFALEIEHDGDVMTVFFKHHPRGFEQRIERTFCGIGFPEDVLRFQTVVPL